MRFWTLTYRSTTTNNIKLSFKSAKKEESKRWRERILLQRFFYLWQRERELLKGSSSNKLYKKEIEQTRRLHADRNIIVHHIIDVD